MPSYPPPKQSKIILARMALRNFIRESRLQDTDFEECDDDEDFIQMVDEPSRARCRRQRRSHASQAQGKHNSDDHNMNDFHDLIAEEFYRRR